MTTKRITVYQTARLRWTDRKGCGQMRQGNAAILAKRLETLRCPATFELLDGTVIGQCHANNGQHENKRIKWIYWYDKEALIKEVVEETRRIIGE